MVMTNEMKKAAVNTGINAVALGLFSAGAVMLYEENFFGVVLIGAGTMLEFVKYALRYLDHSKV